MAKLLTTGKPSTLQLASYALVMGIVASNVGTLATYCRMEWQWNTLMESSGFVDYLPLTDFGWRKCGLVVMSLVAVVLANATHCATQRWHVVAAVVASAVMVVIGQVNFIVTLATDCPETAPAMAMAGQLSAITTFNQNVCTAWCHAAHPSVAGGRICGMKPAAIYDTILPTVPSAVSSWCQLTSTSSDGSPFQALMDKTRPCLIAGGTTHSLQQLPQMASWILSLIALVSFVVLAEDSRVQHAENKKPHALHETLVLP